MTGAVLTLVWIDVGDACRFHRRVSISHSIKLGLDMRAWSWRLGLAARQFFRHPWRLEHGGGVCRRRVCVRGCAEGVRGCAGVEVCWCVGVGVLMKFVGGRHDHQAAAAARCGGGRERSRMFKKDVCGLSLSLSRARVHEGVLFATLCHAPPRLPPS